MSLQLDLSEIDKICRICLFKKENMIEIKSNKIINMIESCASLQITSAERYPNKICIECLEQLLKSFYFKQQCELSNIILMKTLSFPDSEIKHEHILNEDADLNEVVEKFINLPVAPLESELLEKMTLEIQSEINDNDMETKLELEESKEEIKNEEMDNCLDEDERMSWDSESEEDSCCDELKDDSKSQASKSQILLNHTKLMDGDKCDTNKLLCLICNKSLLNLLALARHMNTHSETRIISLECNECGKTFSDPGNLTKHLNRHKGDPQFNCEQCNKKFYELHPLALHMKKKHNASPTKCNNCGVTLYHRLQQERHNRIHAQKVCNICGKVCKTSKLLKRHKSSHSNDRPFSCDICDKSFKFNFEVTKHKKICHSGPQPREICSVCGKSILCRSLPSHMKSHDKGTLYKCEFCPKGYYCEETLKQHVKHKHTNKDCHYKLLCSICGRKVISPKDLRIHMMSHTEEKSYQCQQCDKKYKTPGALTTHVRYTHEDKRPFGCSVCLKAFHTKVILQNHMRTHTGERPFACTVCSRAFGSKSILKTHMKTHNGF